MLWWCLLGCPAEQLGVELPEGGVRTISQEDLQRDCFGLRTNDAGAFWAHRMEQMHASKIEKGEGWVCARLGSGGRRWVAPWPVDTDTAATAAVFISVAKGWDGGEDARLELCIGSVEGEKWGAFAPGKLEGRSSGQADPTRTLEQLSYVELQQKAVQLYELSANPGEATSNFQK